MLLLVVVAVVVVVAVTDENRISVKCKRSLIIKE